jgi:hypothetical protein
MPCGLNVFREATIEAPTSLYYRTITSGINRGLYITFATKSTEDKNWSEWMHLEMAGTVALWYNYQSAVLVVKETA